MDPGCRKWNILSEEIFAKKKESSETEMQMQETFNIREPPYIFYAITLLFREVIHRTLAMDGSCETLFQKFLIRPCTYRWRNYALAHKKQEHAYRSELRKLSCEFKYNDCVMMWIILWIF